MDNLEDDLGPRLTSGEAAAIIGVSEPTMSRMRDRGEGPKYQVIGRQHFYYGKWIQEYLRSTVVVPGTVKGDD